MPLPGGPTIVRFFAIDARIVGRAKDEERGVCKAIGIPVTGTRYLVHTESEQVENRTSVQIKVTVMNKY